jgi:hypothetical protein
MNTPLYSAGQDKAFATWCVMEHARPYLVRTLEIWGLETAAAGLQNAPSLSALKFAAMDADEQIRHWIKFRPLRRDLANAANTLHAAGTFALRGDAVNTAVVVVGVFTNAASARLWRRPWMHLTWRRRRAEVIARTRKEQDQYRLAQL